LRKGRSRVVEENQTVILGWSSQIFTIISELVAANANQPKSCIVVLGDHDKVEMEDEIKGKVGATGKMRVVCRSGNPIDLDDLELASLETSRAIIILSPEGKDNPDADVIKTILAITNGANRRPQPYHIVAEIRDLKNMEVARMVGKDEVELVLVGDLIARIIAQTCRQSGLSIVYTELLDFGGDEIYFKEELGLAGKTFGEALLAYADSTVMGLCSKGGTPRLNPPMETRLQPGDEIIVVSEDDDTIVLATEAPRIQEGAIQSCEPTPASQEHTLILGWNWRAPIIINELDNYVASGSQVDILADYADGEAEIVRRCTQLKNQTVAYQIGDSTDRRTLEALEPANYQHIIVLSYSHLPDAQEADARTLITLLHLRDMAERDHFDFAIVSEMLDLRNRALAEVTHADDFIVSDKLISLMLAQIAENKRLNAVFADIFDPEGSEIYLKPARDYVKLGEPVNFYTVVEAARRRGEVAIGYRIQAEASNAAKSYGVVVNPDKAQAITFGEPDRLVVLAEN
jgi:voltage-gated potassium channel Kch